MCYCGKLPFCIGHITYIFERLATCCALTSVVTCIVTTMLIMLAVGVGLGYNYCYVDVQTGRHSEDEFPLKFSPIESHPTTKKGGKTVTAFRTTTTPLPMNISATMIVPLNIGVNFNSLITNIKKKQMNVTLELIV